MRRLMQTFAVLLLMVLPAMAQRKDDIAIRDTGSYLASIPGAHVRVCPNVATGSPCSPLAPICTDVTLGTCSTSYATFDADAHGNYHFYAPPGLYQVQLTDPSTGAIIAQNDVNIAPSTASPNSWGPVQNFKQPPIGINNYGGLTSFGDSITAGFNATGTNGYVTLMGPDYGGATVNYGTSGDQAADMARVKVYPNTNPTVQHNPTYTVMIGTNDANHAGLVANYEMIFRQTLGASLTWLTVPNIQKLFGQSSEVTKTGTWSNDNTIVSGVGTKSTTSGDSLSFTMTTGAALYVGYRIIDSNGGTAQVRIDGALATDTISSSSTLSAAGFGGQAILTQNGTTDSIALARYAVAPGTHTVSVTVTSASGAGNIFSFLWAGTPTGLVSAIGFPRAFVGGVIRQQSDGSSTATATYDALVQSLVSTLAGDGLYVFYVPTRNYVNTTTDMYNLLHPNDAGHQHLMNAFEFVAQPIASGASSSSLLAINAPAPSSSTNYSNFNVNNVHSSTALNPGWISYNDGANVFGYELGYVTPYLGVTPAYSHRIYSSTDNIPLSICTHPYPTPPTSESSFTCPYYFLINGMPQFAPASPPATVQSYFTTNAKNLHSTTGLNPGVSFYDDGINAFGIDLGWITRPDGSTVFANRIYSSDSAPNVIPLAVCTHASATDPTSQSSFTCPFQVSTTGQVSAPTYATKTNCASAGGTCSSAAAGRVTIAAAASTVTVATTAVTANSEIVVKRDNSLGAALSVTCNTQSSLVLGTPYVSARSVGVSFTITIDVAPSTNPLCVSYGITN